MRKRWWPRSIRGQMLAGLLLLEVLSIGLFAAVLARQQNRRTNQRAQSWLQYESIALANESAEALEQQRPNWVDLAVRTIVEAPIVESAKIISPSGDVLFSRSVKQQSEELSATERAQIPLARRDESRVFETANGGWEAIRPVYTGNDLRGYALVTFDRTAARQQLGSLLDDTAIFGAIWIVASALIVLLMGRAITQPLALLHGGATALMTSPDALTSTSSVPSTVSYFSRCARVAASVRSLAATISMPAAAPVPE